MSEFSDSATDSSYLWARIAVLRDRIAALAGARRERDPAPYDPFRGLHVSDEQVDLLLERPAHRGLPEGYSDIAGDVEDWADAQEQAGPILRVRRLQAAFDLDGVDLDILLSAVLPDVDTDIERVYGYLNDDVSRRRVSVELALYLALADPTSATSRRRLSINGPLVRHGLVTLSQDRPFLSCEITPRPRIVEFLLGGDDPDPLLDGLLLIDVVPLRSPQLGGILSRSSDTLHIRCADWTVARAAAVASLQDSGVAPLVLNASQLPRPAGADAAAEGVAACDVLAAAAREARLTSTWLVVGPTEALPAIPGAVDLLVRDGRSVLIGKDRWDPSWSTHMPQTVTINPLTAADRASLWSDLVGETVPDLSALSAFVLGPDATARSVELALGNAALLGEPLSIEHLSAGARLQNAGGLARLARRIEPGISLEDMVLRPMERGLLDDVVNRFRRRTVVLEDWGMRPGGGRGRGVIALFSGEPGTGKTMAVEAVADELGLDVYAVDLAAVVDKYIGETEKNLDRIFDEAEHVNAVLFFDEADALFGKRSEISDAHDRNANLEVAYLLQRMESFDGLAVLATNLRGNLDAAFGRRLDVIVDFELPDEAHRRLLWERSLGTLMPRAADIDFDQCARLELAGGDIRSIVITAAYRAAAESRPVDMDDLMAAAVVEYRKLGRLIGQREFGGYRFVAAS